MRSKKKWWIALSASVCALALSAGGGLACAQASAAEEVVHSCDESEYCLVCDVADKINALPSAAEITIDNAAAVTQQIHDIDRIKFDLTDAQFEEMSTLVSVGEHGYVYKYHGAIDAINGLQTGVDFIIVKEIVLGSEAVQDTQDVEVSFEVVNLDTNAATTLTMFDLGASVSSLGADYYAQTADGWTFKYKLPAGRYEITEVNADTPTKINGRYWRNTGVSVEVDGQASLGDTATITLTAGEQVVATYMNFYNPVSAYVFVDENGTPISGDVTFTDTNLVGEQTAVGGVYETSEVPTATEGTLRIVSVPDEYCKLNAISYTISYGDMLTFGALKVFQQAENAEATFTVTLLGHAYAWQESTVSCESDGVAEHYFCGNCGGFFDTSYQKVNYTELTVPATGHAYGDWTAISATEEQRECGNCHETETRPLPNDGGESGAEQQPESGGNSGGEGGAEQQPESGEDQAPEEGTDQAPVQLTVPFALIIIGGIFVLAVAMFLATKKY